MPEDLADSPGDCSPSTYCHFQSYDPHFPDNASVYPCVETDLNLYPGCATNMANIDIGWPGIFTAARRGGFYNNRENEWVAMLNVNVHDLLRWNRASGGPLFNPDDTTQGGIVLFLTVKGPGSNVVSSPRYGVRVFGSPNFDFPPAADPTGLTVVSDQAIYVEGHYNVDATAVGIYDATHPWMPAALMGDAINVLSSNWSGDPNSGWHGTAGCRNDCQSRKSLNSPRERPAQDTFLNAAFLGGTDVTAVGNYNGGFENYPRFHERWAGETLRYRGSIVSLGQAQRNNGGWCGTGGSLGGGCNIYNPPARDWDYDTNFQEVRNLPPLTPRVVSVEQILFTENFR